jgi:hypothetical protein
VGNYERYLHHDRFVWVQTDLRGKHWAHSLCHKCAHEGNCQLIALIFELCKFAGVTLPIWECPNFEEKCHSQEQ